MHYADSTYMVRGDFFKDTDKWYTTEAISMEHCWDITTAVHAVAAAWWVHDHFTQSPGFRLVVLEPCHRNAHPVMIRMENLDALLADVNRWHPELANKLNQIRTQRRLVRRG